MIGHRATPKKRCAVKDKLFPGFISQRGTARRGAGWPCLQCSPCNDKRGIWWGRTSVWWGVILWNEFSSKVCFDVSFTFYKQALKTFLSNQVYCFVINHILWWIIHYLFVSCTSALVIFLQIRKCNFLRAHTPVSVSSSLSLDAIYFIFYFIYIILFGSHIVFLMTINTFELNNWKLNWNYTFCAKNVQQNTSNIDWLMVLFSAHRWCSICN